MVFPELLLSLSTFSCNLYLRGKSLDNKEGGEYLFIVGSYLVYIKRRKKKISCLI